MGTPTMPPKGVIKARAQARVGALCAMIHVATPSPKAAQRAEQQSAKKDWMKDAMAKRVKNKTIADALDKLLASLKEQRGDSLMERYRDSLKQEEEFYQKMKKDYFRRILPKDEE